MPITKASGQAVAPAAKGDLVVGSATNDAAVLGVGSADQVLTVDSSTTTGLKWATPSAGSMTLISRQTPSAASSLSFGSIPATYTDLLMRWAGLYVSNNTTGFDVRLNNDSATNYLTFYFYESGVGTGNDDRIFVNRFMNRNNNTTDFRLNAKGWMKVSNYANTSYRKQIDAVSFFNDSAAGNMAYHGSNIYNSNSAITSIDIYRNSGTGTFSTISGGYIELWGVK